MKAFMITATFILLASSAHGLVCDENYKYNGEFHSATSYVRVTINTPSITIEDFEAAGLENVEGETFLPRLRTQASSYIPTSVERTRRTTTYILGCERIRNLSRPCSQTLRVTQDGSGITATLKVEIEGTRGFPVSQMTCR